MKNKKFTEKPLAITDTETTGLDYTAHEIIEIGLVLINQPTLEIIDKLDIKIKPENIANASLEAIAINGYNENDWRNAVSLKDAMEAYSLKTADAIFCSHNTTFDWSFIETAFKKTKIKNLMDYHRLDLFTMAWTKLSSKNLEKFNLKEIAKFLDIPEEPLPHRAINGAMTAYEIFKKLKTG